MYVIVFWAIGAAATVDAVARSQAEWVAADRNKGWWVTCRVVLGAAGAFAYVLLVLPKLVPGGRRARSDPFAKR